MPEDFKEEYPSNLIWDLEKAMLCEMPNSLLLNSELLSSYKNHTILKVIDIQ